MSRPNPAVCVAASFTSEPLEPVLKAWLRAFGSNCELEFAPYRQVLQQLLDPASLLSRNGGGLNVVLVRGRDFGVDGVARARSASREVAAALAESASRDSVQTLVLACPVDGGGEAEECFAGDLAEQLESVPGVEFFGSSRLLELYPVDGPFDAESEESAGIPYTPAMFAALATFLARSLTAVRRKPYKVIAVDADQTLWSGVCAEAGPRGVVVDEGRRALQRFLVERRDEGYLLCLVSKNAEEDVEAVFRENPDMVLPREAFVATRVNWRPKSENLLELAAELNLGADSIVFLDDNPAEIAEVGANAPAVLPVRVPAESAGLPAFLGHLWMLDRVRVSVDDSRRADFYHDEMRRRAMRESSASFADFLEGLQLDVRITVADDADLVRACQLTQRTNQFNANPNPRSEAEMIEASRGMQVDMVHVRDRFGDYGTVGLMVYREDGGRLWVETFLLSCRALGKGVEQRMMRYLARLAGVAGLTDLAIGFRDTGRNAPCRDFLDGLEGVCWEDGLCIIPQAAAAKCPLVPPTAGPARAKGVASVPQFDHELAHRIAHDLREVSAIVDWAAVPVRPRPDLGVPFAAPRGDVEEGVAGIWCEVLGLESVGRDDRFVDLGGSSLQLVRVHAEIQRRFGRRFELVRMFENPTLADQARLAEGSDERAPAAAAGGDGAGPSEGPDDHAVAIVGMAVRLPGASTPDELWRNLRDGVETIERIDPSELEVPADLDDPNLVCARGLLDPEVYEGIDGGLFGILPREAEIIDPQQRVFLEICWEALERAGYVPDDAEASGSRVGVYAGCYYDTYLPHHILSDPAVLRRHLAEAQVGALQVEFGNDKDHLATRVAFKLNLKGPSLSVQTACSTSLVAVSHAVMSLRSGQCDMALAGGVTVTVPQKRAYHHEEGGMLSRDGHCRPFEENSSGTVFSNGGGVVLLKRLRDAERDGDTIHAVLRGFGLNNDGGVKHSYAAPSADGQADVIRRAHRDAGVDPRTISYVEAHGTATPLGDPIEVTGLTQAFRQATGDKGFCALGSLKSNLGHLDTAAGVCGLIKTTLSLKHGELPPLLHFEKPNPRIDFANSPFFVNDRLREWKDERGGPLRAGVSSFGVGGTNAHVVLEQYRGPRPAAPAGDRSRVFVLSARSEEALGELAGRLAAHADEASMDDFAAAARTLGLGRKSMAHRAAVAGGDWKSIAGALRAKRWVSRKPGGKAPGMVWMFPGQGAQHPGMTAGLYAAEPGYRADIDRCAEILRAELGEDLRETLFAEDGAEAAEKLKHTVLAQPAIFVVEYALARQWQRWGVEPELMLGHSVGEFTAACLAGVFPLEDALRILAARGRLMGSMPGGSMLSVRLSADELRKVLPAELDLAAENGPALCVVAGERERVAAFAAELEADGVNVRPLHTSHAFHSRMMDGVIDPFRQVIERATLSKPSIAILSTVTGGRLSDEQATDPGYWAAHLRRTVCFHGAVEAAAAEQEGRLFLEVGPGQTLTTLARQTAGRRAAGCVPSCEHPASDAPDHDRMLLSLGELWCHGVEVDWQAVHADVPARRVELPTYPFQRRRAWLPCQLLDQALPAVEATATTAASAAPVEPVEAPAQVTVEAPVVSGTSVADQVREVLEDLSGIPAEEMDESAGFLELGFDSLLLTQAAREIQKVFGVPISFRDLMQQYPNVGALAAHLGENASVEPAPAAPAASTPAKQAAVEVVKDESADGPEEESGVAGPRTRIDRTVRSSELSDEQQQHLRDLTERYNARTRRSKELTQQYRPYHADPRTVNGFNRLWKEMVYQIVAERMKGSRMWDVDGNEYIDMVNGFGPNFLGHSPDFVTEAIEKQLATGLEIGPQCLAAMETSKLFCEVTGNERACFLNTGSEAVQAAMRIARTVTGRDKVLVFDKDYHGNFDPVLVRSVGKGARRRTLPLAPGIPDSAVTDVIVVPWGRPEALDMVREVAGELAAVLVEPVQSRQPELIPVDFVREVKRISEEHGFLLVFDEVITGLRQGLRGAQALYGIEADLATYGKVFGGGALPIGIVGGKAKYMDTFDGGQWQYGDDSFPEKEVTFFAGTFVRLPLAMAACRAVLEHLREKGPEYWDDIGRRADRLASTVDSLFRDHGIDVRMVNFGSQMYLRIGDGARHGNLIYYHLREKGIFAMEGLPFYLTAAHSDEDVDRVIEAFRETIAELQSGGFFPGSRKLEAVAGSAVRGPFPMTEPMAEIWLGSSLGEEANLAFNEMLQLRLGGPVDAGIVQAAIQDLVDRHDALRMRVAEEHGTSFVIDRHQPAAVELLDLRGDEDPEARVLEAGRRERETPFDLLAGPLFRVVALRTRDDEMVLQFVAHHIACDGWSFEVLVKDFSACYEARRNGGRPGLGPAPSIVDRALRPRVDDGSLEWWREQFSAGAPEVELPLRKGYGVEPSYLSATSELTLDRDALQALRRLSGQCGATLNATLLGGFQALLHQLGGQRRFVMTFPSAGQMDDGDEELVGHCVNFLPLLAEVDAGEDFRALTRRASDGQLDALEHGKVTYGELLRALRIGRDGGRRPLMEVIFNVEPSGDPGGFGGLSSRVETVPARYSNSTIFLNLMLLPDGLLLSSTYNRELIDEGTMQAWLECYRALLLDAAADPSKPVGELTLLDRGGRDQIDGWTRGGARRLAGSIHARFREVCRDHGDRVAVRDAAGACSYADLGGRVAAVAAGLREAGVQPGERVGLDLSKGRDLIASILGVLEAGAAFVPVEPDHPEARKAAIFEDAGVRVILGGAAPDGVEAKVLSPAILPAAATTPVAREPGDPAYVLFTSGSTGTPKGVVGTHQAVLRLVVDPDYATLGPDEVILQGSTVAFDASTFEIFGALLNGGTLVMPEAGGATLESIARKIREEKVTTVWFTAGLFELMVEEHLADLGGLRQVLAGGDVLSPPHVRRFLEGAPGVRLINGYGPTENTTFTTCHTIRPADADGGAIPIGRPIAGGRVEILDDRGRRVPVGVPGELHCGGAGLALGYLNDPGLTARRFVPDPIPGHEGERLYRTGDLCRWTAEGVIEFLGRRDHQLKLRGFRIEPGEIEAVLESHPAVRRAKVAARGDGAGGKRLLAWYQGDGEPDFRDWLEDRLPSFMHPEAVTRVDGFPLNANGKVDVAALPEPRVAVAADRRPPAGGTEIRLAAIWSEMLDIPQPGRDDDFFDLGGNSLAGLRMFAAIRREFGCSLPLATLLRAKTVRTLAGVIDGAAPAAPATQASTPVHRTADGPSGFLAEVQPEGEGTPVFAIHGGDGGILFYREMAKHLSHQRPFLAIESPDLSRGGEIRIDPIEVTAAAYVEMMKRRQPEGPYYVAGYSYGGLVAYEMARQLVEAGEEVPFLALFDTLNPQAAVRRYSLPERVSVFWNARRDEPLMGRLKSLAVRFREGANTNLRVKAEVAAAERSAPAEAHSELRGVQLREAHYQAMQAYRPRPFHGALTLFRASDVSDKFEFPAEYGWSHLVDELRIRQVPGEHLTLFEPGNARMLAREFEQQIP